MQLQAREYGVPAFFAPPILCHRCISGGAVYTGQSRHTRHTGRDTTGIRPAHQSPYVCLNLRFRL